MGSSGIMDEGVPAEWEETLSAGIADSEILAERLGLDPGQVRPAGDRYPFLLNSYVLSQLKQPGDPWWLQAVPGPDELTGQAPPDPLNETAQSPAPGLIHRYPDRVLWIATTRCAMYCRHCFRKRLVGRANPVAGKQALEYIQSTPAIKEVVVSGGDPLVLGDGKFFGLLDELGRVPHVEILRIHTRVPGVLPQRITPEFCGRLAKFHPLFLVIQFNHPLEVTPQAARACAALADAGIPLFSQSVLLMGVNDDADVLEDLFRSMLRLRVRPYYLHHPDHVEGNSHFQVSLERGLALVEELENRLSGLALPKYVLDLPGGGGKVALCPDRRASDKNGAPVFRGLNGGIFPAGSK